MAIIAETERLILREFEESDAQEFYELNADPEVMKYTGDIVFKDVDHALSLIVNYPDYKKNGFGRNTLILKETNEFIGWCGLKQLGPNEIDLGFRLLRKHWNKGYATESSLKHLELGFGEYGLNEIWGYAHPDNIGSNRVIEKCGFTYIETKPYDTLGDCNHWRLKKEEYYA